jgi:mannose-1-phosphate guanylyltransferase
VLELFDGKSLFQVALARLDPMFSPREIVVLCPPDLMPGLARQAPELPAENFYLEPEPRGNAAALGLAALRLRRQDPEGVMACLTSDHIIQNVTAFQALLAAAQAAAAEGNLVTLGIEPTAPDSSYGYIERGSSAGEYGGMTAFHVSAFKEKPDIARAREYVTNGGYAWNSGMFVWRVDALLAEIERQMPALFTGLTEIDAALGTEDELDVIARVWAGVQPTSIDYGIMEGAQRAVMFSADNLGWVDVGDWSRLQRLYDLDEAGNAIRAGNIVLTDSSRNFVVAGKGAKQDRLIVLHDVNDLIIVDTGDVLLLVNREKAGDVKDIVEQLKQAGFEKYL